MKPEKKEQNLVSRITLPGYPLPLGATLDSRGVQFSIFSRHAKTVTLELYETADPDSSFEEIKLDPDLNKTGDIWHVWVAGLKEGQLYAYRIDGEYNPEEGHRFNKFKLLLDPYARAVSGSFNWNMADARGFDSLGRMKDGVLSTKDSGHGAPKCVVINHDFDWFDRPLKKHFTDTIIYELHVKGFSFHQSSPVEHKGTYRGIIELIPYLKELGVSAVELLPIHEFDETENININPETGVQLKNYWGYSTISFFAPRGRYSSSGSSGEQVYEFKEMVRDLHNAGIEVILDVVFNHTAEGDHTGPTLCFRGIDNKIYYMLEKDKRYYKNYAGCGNTFNCNNTLVREFIIDCLKYWVIEMHIDGFRFDLASILGRDEDGNILANPPLIERIEADPILRTTKIIAEAWDAAGAYQVGNFPGRWAEWNGKYRDDVRRFWRGDDNMTGVFSTRITGSSDLYGNSRSPLHSINFITCHDGFTLNDLICYSRKHNEANGEGNRDGDNNSFSNNWGIEGMDATGMLEHLRGTMLRNYITTLFLSQGTPMIMAGDEFRRTQQGNNNAYCQDSEISWIDWTFKEKNRDLFEFTKKIIQFRKNHPIFRRKTFFKGVRDAGYASPDIVWHGVHIGQPDWSPLSKFIACVLNGQYARIDTGVDDADFYLAFNPSPFTYTVEIPESPSGLAWKRIIDTSLATPDDFVSEKDAKPLSSPHYLMKRRSMLVLIAE